MKKTACNLQKGDKVLGGPGEADFIITKTFRSMDAGKNLLIVVEGETFEGHARSQTYRPQDAVSVRGLRRG